jgi:hypothetical protein
VIEPASSGRAKCRGCRRAIAKGELRMGELILNPYGEGEAKVWFHLVCGACRRPEVFQGILDAAGGELPGEVDPFVLEAVEHGQQSRRLERMAGVQRAPSGRARCRHCRQSIGKDSWRFVLEIWEDGRFAQAGFAHIECGPEYFELDDREHLARRIRRLAGPDQTPEELDDVAELLQPQGVQP